MVEEDEDAAALAMVLVTAAPSARYAATMAMKHLESRSGNSASVKHDTKLVITSSG
jgi:hypothetical protein